jgi:hypothetical protein
MMRELARLGAAARVMQLRAELAQLERTFPGVTGAAPRRGRPAAAAAAEGAQPVKRKRRKMSAAARKKISDAQKRRWAKQKAKTA